MSWSILQFYFLWTAKTDHDYNFDQVLLVELSLLRKFIVDVYLTLHVAKVYFTKLEVDLTECTAIFWGEDKTNSFEISQHQCQKYFGDRTFNNPGLIRSNNSWLQIYIITRSMFTGLELLKAWSIIIFRLIKIKKEKQKINKEMWNITSLFQRKKRTEREISFQWFSSYWYNCRYL